MRLRILPALFFLFFAFPQFLQSAPAATVFEKTEEPAKRLFPGEVLTYRIHYLGIPVGEGRAEVVEKTMVRGREAWHVVVTVRSFRAIDLVYKVRDEHHTWIDTETLASLGYSKKVREGRRKRDEKTDYDLAALTASREAKGEKKTFSIPAGTQDQLSCGYWFRTLSVKPQGSVNIPVEAGGKNWNMEVKTYGTRKMTLGKIGEFEAIEAEPLMPFEGIFIRKSRIRGWMSLDKRRIPLKMSVKIPVLGAVTAELESYQPGRED